MRNRTKILMIGGLIVAAVSSFLVANGGLTADRCRNIVINIENPEGQPFISTEDVQNLVTNNGESPLEGVLFDKINMSELEKWVLSNKQVKSCEIHADLKGNLVVDVVPHLPIARILRTNEEDSYLAEDGTIFPTSSHYTARVLLLEGPYFKGLRSIKSAKRKPLIDFIKYIQANEFWKAQITQLTLSETGKITLVPLLGNHIIEFGDAQNVEAKLRRLNIFYDKIAGVPAWSNFSVVSVAYANQIVAR